ncbi:MAG: TIM barrel protein, partial [Planctomycetota bacterium]|nr:TIM barrel protein [Planctomycetota bacterium]
MPFNRRQFLALSAALPTVGSQLASQTSTGLSSNVANRFEFAINIEMWFRKLDFADRIRATADLGFKWVEFWPWRNKDLDEIQIVCEETGVRVAQFTGWGFFPGMNNPKNHDKFEEDIRAACATAKKINAPMVTVVGGNDQAGMTREEMHTHITTALKRVAPIAEENQIMLILEPMNIRVDHKGHCLYGSSDAVRICRVVNSPMVKINWDLYHMQISEGDLCGRLREGFDQVGYIQLADHPGRKEPGTGEIQYGRVFQELQALGYEGPIGCECSPLENEKIAALRIEKAANWA